ncbi:hypothetical protein J6590_021331 [Homalodisca vitripennis]|nr:hypothetical protein J6590_021331 [Homalodisca vitripennis]
MSKLEEKGIPYDYNPEIEILPIENKELEKKPTLKPEIPQEQQESERFRQNPENYENPEGRRESERFRQNPENHENPEGRRESERFRQNPENHENPEEKRASDEQPVINQLRTTKEQVKFLNEKFHFHPKPKKEKDPPKYKEENKITQQIAKTHSPDLTTPDAYVWGMLKENIFREDPPSTIVQLEEKITICIRRMEQPLFIKIMQNLQERYECCLKLNGVILNMHPEMFLNKFGSNKVNNLLPE